MNDVETFCSRNHARLVGMLSLYCGERAIAEELAQEALARVWRDWRKVAGMDRPEAWLHKVALNLARSHFRRTSAERRATARVVPATHYEEPDSAEKQAVRDAVCRLPVRQKTALILRYYLDLPYLEIAVRMGVPEATARSLVSRAIARLRLNEGFDRSKEVADAT